MITLLVFPIPTIIGLPYFEGIEWKSIFEFENLTVFKLGIGIEFGVFYGFLALLFMQAPVFDKLPNNIEHVIRRMKLKPWDYFFLSLCAGVGEELLFRSGVQFYLGPIITSVVFVAIHGYLNPMNWRMSLYGLLVLPFILGISYGFIEFGLWFAIGAHFAYDFVIFSAVTKE